MKIDGTTVLLIGGAAVAAYLLTRPRTVTPPAYQPAYNPYSTYPVAQQNPTAGIISAAGGAAGNIIKAIWP